MKKIYKSIKLFVVLLSLVSIKMNAQNCFSASQYPSTTISIASTGTTNITTCNFAGEYSVLNFTAAGSYNFNSTGGAGNYLTITDNSNNPVGAGYSLLGVVIPSVGVYRCHVSLSPACGTDGSCHNVSVSGSAFCTSASQYPSTTTNIANSGLTTITTCNFGGEYSVNNFTATGIYTVNATGGAGNYVTVKNVAGTIIYAQGIPPLAVNIAYTGLYRIHLAVAGPTACTTDGSCHNVNVTGPAAPGCAGAPAASSVVATPTVICAGANSSLSLSATYTASGIAYQWSSASALAGPYTAITGATLSTYAANALTTNTFYIAVITCTNGPASTTASAVQVSVNPLPTISVTPTLTSICMPGASSVALTATGGTTYTWTPSATLSSSVGASVNALPSVSTIYTVTGSSAAGCTAKATTTINVAASPSLTGISATPSVICAGSNSTLQASATLNNFYSVTSIPYAAIPTPSTAVTVLCNNGTASVVLTSGTLDDGGWSNQIIPFNFNFFGTTTNSFAVSTNGFVFLGAGNPLTFTGYNNIFPSTTPAKPAIGANYSDLDFDGVGSGSTIQYFTTGTTPNQKLVVNWTGQFYPNTGTVTTQAIVYETTNVIEVHTFTSTGTNNTVEGIQNSTGTLAFVAPGRNNVLVPIVTADAYRWTPGSISYSWSPSSFLSSTSTATTVANSATASTIYTVNATGSNGCAVTGSVNLTVNTTTISVNSGTICSGNTFTLNASGATTYTYSSGPVVNPTSTSNYSVVGTGTNGCVSSAVISTVVVNALPTVAITGTTSTCIGNSVVLTAGGANTYTWNTTAITTTISVSPSTPTTYTVAGTDLNNCSNTATFALAVNPNPVVTVTNGTICSGNSFTLSPSGAATYSFSTGPVVTPSANATYSIIGTSSVGCTGSVVATVSVNTTPTVNATSSASLICAGQTASLTASGAATYSWNTTSTNTVIAVSPSVTTSYTVTGSTNSCSSNFVISQAVSPCTGIDAKATSLVGILVYPNPNTGEFTVELNNGAVKSIQVMDLTGRVIISNTTSNDKIDFNINTLANGVYYVKIQSNNSVEVIKIVKQ